MVPLTSEELQRIQDFVSSVPKKKKRLPTPTPQELLIQDPTLRGVVENASNIAEDFASKPNQQLIAGFQAAGIAPQQQITTQAPDIAAPTARQQALQKITVPPQMSEPELEREALLDLRAAQSGAQRAESILPYIQAAQLINQAWTGAPVDVGTLGTVQKSIRAKEADAAQRLQAAQEFIRRRIAQEQFGQTLAQRKAESEAELQARKQAAAEQLGLRNREIALSEKALEARQQQAQAELEAKAARGRGPAPIRPTDELAKQMKELQLKKLQKELAGELSPAEQKKKRETLIDVNERAANIDRNLQELEQLVVQGGTYDAFGPQNRNLKDKIYQVAVDIAKLMDPNSVAREGEVNSVMKFSLFEPTPFMRDSTAIELIQSLRNSMRARQQEAYRVRGLTPETIAPQQKQQPTTAGLSPEKQARLEELRRKKEIQ